MNWNVPCAKIQLISLLSLAIFLVSVSPRVQASPGQVTIYLEPSNYVFGYENATIGTLFNVTVWVESDTYPYNLMMWQVCLKFNSSMISPVFYYSETWTETLPLVWPNDDMGGRNFNESYVFYRKTGGTIAKQSYNATEGSILHCDLLFNEIPIDGRKILCIITFNVTAVPTDGALVSPLHLDDDLTFLYDYDGPIPHEVVMQDGTYIFIPEYSVFAISVTLLATSIGTTLVRKRLNKKF